MSRLPEIMIVEDNYSLRETLADYLLAQGFNLRCADDGEELNAALAERNIECHFLGARTPFAALEAMVEKFAPPAIFLWAQLVENADPSYFKDLPTIRPAPRVLLGGPGWSESDCANMTKTPDLNYACEEITRAVGA